MVTRNIKLVAQGQADATYADNQKKNPFRLSSAILNGDAYAPATLAMQNFAAGVTPYIFRQQALVDLFSTFTIGTWTLNGSAASSVTPLGIQLMYANTDENIRSSSTFNDNAVINVTYPFTITETFNTTTDATSTRPLDGFVLALSPNKNFLGGGGSDAGILNGAPPAFGISVLFASSPDSAVSQIITNADRNPYNASKVGLGFIWSDVKNNASANVTVSVTYDGSNTMAWSVSESVYLFSSSQTGINLQTLLGSSTAYLGATAGSGARYQPVYLTGATYQTYA
jgi:hypothetical protein